jgi:aminoglycoside 3'-phosphotransferase-1
MQDDAREIACAPVAAGAVPPALLAGYRWARDTVGESGGAVWRLHGKAGAPDLYLKHGRGDIAGDITDEMVRLAWLGRHVAVPAIVHFHRSVDEAWLLMTALPGQTAYQCLEADAAAGPAVVDALAGFLGRLHAIPVAACPFNADADHRLMLARQRLDAGLVATDEFDDARAGWTAAQVWAAMQALLPLAPDPVVTHGDFSLDNLLIAGGEVVGCIDVGRAGIADRYQDLAILWNCLGEFDAALPARLFTAYGIARADKAKLQFHTMLDEFF